MFGYSVGTLNINQSGYLIQNTNQTRNITFNDSTIVYNIHLISSGSGSVLTISNGQTGSVFIKVTGTASTGATFDFGINGVRFPLGAYVTVDGSIVSATIACGAYKS